MTAEKARNESARLQAELYLTKNENLNKLKEKVATTKRTESPDVRRFRQSVQNKTKYLVRLSQEQNAVEGNMDQIQEL